MTYEGCAPFNWGTKKRIKCPYLCEKSYFYLGREDEGGDAWYCKKEDEFIDDMDECPLKKEEE